MTPVAEGLMIEPIPLTDADRENIAAVNAMLTFARNRQPHKREAFYKAAGQHLEMLRRGKTVEIWAEVVRKNVGIGVARAYELIELGAGRKTQAELRARKGVNQRRWKASQRQKKTDPAAKSEA